MQQYKEITSIDYVIQRTKCRCNACDSEFLEYTPLNYELVCFIDASGEKYFLPTYGEYGYLYLLEKIVEDWKPSERITMGVIKKFEEKLVEITPHSVSLFQKIKCPACSKGDIMVLERIPIKNYPVNWMKIDIEKVQFLKS